MPDVKDADGTTVFLDAQDDAVRLVDAVAKVLVEECIFRGQRTPFGKRSERLDHPFKSFVPAGSIQRIGGGDGCVTIYATSLGAMPALFAGMLGPRT
jgi:hypothetical protein